LGGVALAGGIGSVIIGAKKINLYNLGLIKCPGKGGDK
jgi:hypothetical protein